MTIYIVVLEYQGHTKIWKEIRVWLDARDTTDAQLLAMAFFYREHPELKNSVAKVVGYSGVPVSDRLMERRRLIDAELLPEAATFAHWYAMMPYFEEVKHSHWVYDPKARHRGRNRHKKGKLVKMTSKTRIIKRRFTDDGEPASE